MDADVAIPFNVRGKRQGSKLPNIIRLLIQIHVYI